MSGTTKEVMDNKAPLPETLDGSQCASPAQVSPHTERSKQKEMVEKLQNKSINEQNANNTQHQAEAPKASASHRSLQQSGRSQQSEISEESLPKTKDTDRNVSNTLFVEPTKGFKRRASQSDGVESDTFSDMSSARNTTTTTTDYSKEKKMKKKTDHVIAIIQKDNVTKLKRLHDKNLLGPLKSPQWKGMTLLHWASLHGALECIFWLLQDPEVSPNAAAKNKWTPLHIAAMKGQDASAKAILNSSAYTLSLDHMGRCALHLAAAHGNTYTLNAMLQKGLLSEVEHPDVNGWSPIFHAVYHNRIGCIQSLIVHGAITDNVDYDGNSLVHLAAMEGHIEALKLLFYSGHPVNGTHFLVERNNEGFKPNMLAKRYHKDEVAHNLLMLEKGTFLRDSFENIAFPGHMAALRGKEEVLKNLIDKEIVKINEPDTYGYTLLHRAVLGGNTDIVKLLLLMKADPRIRNNAQETPLDVAIRCEDEEMADILRTDMEEDPVESRDSSDIRMDLDKRLSMKRRCEERVNFCLNSLRTAVENFRQVGGTLDITDAHVKLVTALKESERQIFELKDKLAYDRLVRENIQAELDKKQREIKNLTDQCKNMNLIQTRQAATKFIPKNDLSRFKTAAKRKKSPPKKQRPKKNSGVFVKVKKASTPEADEEQADA